ncbi:hypothetical protein D3C75_462240 [compost metagenome]
MPEHGLNSGSHQQHDYERVLEIFQKKLPDRDALPSLQLIIAIPLQSGASFPAGKPSAIALHLLEHFRCAPSVKFHSIPSIRYLYHA